MVPGAGIEPARLAARDFESRASTSSAIPATQARYYGGIALQEQVIRARSLILLALNGGDMLEKQQWSVLREVDLLNLVVP